VFLNLVGTIPFFSHCRTNDKSGRTESYVFIEALALSDANLD
jgi:hypothetical protein